MTRFARLPRGVLPTTLILGLAWFLLVGDAMRKAGAPVPAANGKAVHQLALEFAGSATVGLDYLRRWGNDATQRIRTVIYLDFDMIPGYLLLLGSLVLLVSGTVGPDARIPAGLLLWMVIAGGLLDVVENLLMLSWLSDTAGINQLPLTRVTSFAKWALIILAVAGSLYNLLRRHKLISPAPVSPAPGS